MTEKTEMANGSGRKMVHVTPAFWKELRDFCIQNGISAMDLKRAGINYNTSSRILKGTQNTQSVNSDYMMTFADMVSDPEKYKVRVIEGAISSISEMLNMNLTSN